jgi:PIN domain nuclease of toxin-antitoxin system
MSAVVLDTHAALWALLTPEKLSSRAKLAIEAASNRGDPVYISAISLVEVAYLVEKGRLPEAAYERLTLELAQPDGGLVVAPLNLPVAQAVRQIPRETVPDMPDRIIAATALHLGLPLLTCDRAIQAFQVETIW